MCCCIVLCCVVLYCIVLYLDFYLSSQPWLTYPRGETKDLANDPSHGSTINTLLDRLDAAGATGEARMGVTG